MVKAEAVRRSFLHNSRSILMCCNYSILLVVVLKKNLGDDNTVIPGSTLRGIFSPRY
jgi:hypothetical protein